MSTADRAPAWVAQKAAMDAADDGDGPYMEHYPSIPLLPMCGPPPEWPAFKVWADSHLGQGFSLACAEGCFLDMTTAYCFKGYCAGRHAAGCGNEQKPSPGSATLPQL